MTKYRILKLGTNGGVDLFMVQKRVWFCWVEVRQSGYERMLGHQIEYYSSRAEFLANRHYSTQELAEQVVKELEVYECKVKRLKERKKEQLKLIKTNGKREVL